MLYNAIKVTEGSLELACTLLEWVKTLITLRKDAVSQEHVQKVSELSVEIIKNVQDIFAVSVSANNLIDIHSEDGYDPIYKSLGISELLKGIQTKLIPEIQAQLASPEGATDQKKAAIYESLLENLQSFVEYKDSL